MYSHSVRSTLTNLYSRGFTYPKTKQSSKSLANSFDSTNQLGTHYSPLIHKRHLSNMLSHQSPLSNAQNSAKSHSLYSAGMLSKDALIHFNETLHHHYTSSSESKENGIQGGFKPKIATLATNAEYNLSIGSPPWQVPTSVLQSFNESFMFNPTLFSNTPLDIDSQAIVDSISTISGFNFSNPTYAIPTPALKLTTAYYFRQLKKLGVTHVAIQIPWFTPSVISALNAGLTIVPIFSTNESNICETLISFSKKYKDKGVFWHNPTNPIHREFSDSISAKIVQQFQHSGTFLVGDYPYWDCGPLLPGSNKGLLYTYLSRVASESKALGFLSTSKGAIRIEGAHTRFAISNNKCLITELSDTITRAQSSPSKLDTQLALHFLEYAASTSGQHKLHHDLSQCAEARDLLIERLNQYGVPCSNTGVFVSVQLRNSAPGPKLPHLSSNKFNTFRIPSFALTRDNIDDISKRLATAFEFGLNPAIAPYQALLETGILALDHDTFFSPPSASYVQK